MRHRRVRGATPIAPRTYFEGTAIGGLSVNSLTVKILLQKLAITVTVGSLLFLLFSSPTVAQVLSPAEKAARVEITQEPGQPSIGPGRTSEVPLV